MYVSLCVYVDVDVDGDGDVDVCLIVRAKQLGIYSATVYSTV